MWTNSMCINNCIQNISNEIETFLLCDKSRSSEKKKTQWYFGYGNMLLNEKQTKVTFIL